MTAQCTRTVHICTCVSSFVASETAEPCPLSPTDIQVWSLSRSLIHRQTWRLAGYSIMLLYCNMVLIVQPLRSGISCF